MWRKLNITKKIIIGRIIVLFSWFRGDFGGPDEVKKILKSYGITNEEPENLEFKTYDWTMSLGNYREIPDTF